jgi:hypothetical protein
MPLTGCLMFVYICIDVGDLVEGRVGMPLTGSLLFVYICIDVGEYIYRQTLDYLLMAPQPSPLLDHQHQYIYRQTLDYLLMASQHLPSTGSPTSIHI